MTKPTQKKKDGKTGDDNGKPKDFETIAERIRTRSRSASRERAAEAMGKATVEKVRHDVKQALDELRKQRQKKASGGSTCSIAEEIAAAERSVTSWGTEEPDPDSEIAINEKFIDEQYEAMMERRRKEGIDPSFSDDDVPEPEFLPEEDEERIAILSEMVRPREPEICAGPSRESEGVRPSWCSPEAIQEHEELAAELAVKLRRAMKAYDGQPEVRSRGHSASEIGDDDPLMEVLLDKGADKKPAKSQKRRDNPFEFVKARATSFPNEEDTRKEILDMPSPDIAARNLELTASILYVADHSKNLKGTFVKQLRTCAKMSQVCCEELFARTYAPTDVVALRQENAELRKRVAENEANRRTQMGEMQEKINRLRDKLSRITKEPRMEEGDLPGKAGTSPAPGATKSDLERMEERILTRVEDMVRTLLRKQQASLPVQSLDESRGLKRKRVGTKERKTADPTPCEDSKKPRVIDVQTLPRAISFAECVNRANGKNKRTNKMVTSTPIDSEQEDERPVPRRPSGRRDRVTSMQTSTGEETSDPEKEKSISKGKKKKVKKKKKKPKVGRVPSTAAVAISLAPEVKLDEVIREARSNINLEDVGIGVGEIDIRRSLTGGAVLQIRGEDRKDKARALAGKMKALFEAQRDKISISVPQKMAELRISRIEGSITAEELASAIAKLGDCDVQNVKVGKINSLPRGLGTAWVSCPVAAAKKISREGKFGIGWTTVVVTPLEARPLQCFKCLEFGHVKAMCTGTKDRSNLCFKCGASDHLVAQCLAERQTCLICRDKGHDDKHRMGGPLCHSLTESRKKTPPSGRRRTEPQSAAETRTKKAATSTDEFKKPTAPPPKSAKKGVKKKEAAEWDTTDPEWEQALLRETIGTKEVEMTDESSEAP